MQHDLAAIPWFPILIAAFVLWQYVAWRRACRKGASQILTQMRALFSSGHQLEPTQPALFDHVTQDGYRRVYDTLVPMGFAHLGAYENLTVSSAIPEQRTFADCYVSIDKIIGVGTYFAAGQQVVDLITELSDGRFVTTSNAAADKLDSPPELMRETVAPETSLPLMLAMHHDRVGALLAANPGLTVATRSTLADAMRVSQRISLIIGEYRQRIGYLSEAEVMRLLPRPGMARTARRVYRDFCELRDQNRGNLP